VRVGPSMGDNASRAESRCFQQKMECVVNKRRVIGQADMIRKQKMDAQPGDVDLQRVEHTARNDLVVQLFQRPTGRVSIVRLTRAKGEDLSEKHFSQTSSPSARV